MSIESSAMVMIHNYKEEYLKVTDVPESAIKEDSVDLDDDYVDESSSGDKTPEEEPADYSMSNLPLEVITTIDPYDYQCVGLPLKHMSNGNLTHRNIFTEEERDVLRTIVEKYRGIVDTRKRTRATFIEKQTVWQHIVEEFNGSDNVMIRTEKELKKCWDNMKYRARLAEKEQQRVENLNIIVKNSSHTSIQNMSSNTVQVALEKMLTDKSEKVNESDSNQSANEKNDWSQNCNNDMDSDECTGSETKDDADLEDELPLFKKVREESPKLSSILLGDGKLSNYQYSKSTVPQYIKVSNNTKVFSTRHKKVKKNNPITILPKSLSSCVSITNIPNPNHVQNNSNILDVGSNYSDFRSSFGPINLGSGITISPQISNGLPKFNDSTSAPNSKNMLPSKCKKYSASKNIMNGTIDNIDDGYETGGIEEKLLQQRLGFETKEHNMKIKVLEKQLQAHFNESQYWELKLKLLKNGQESLSGKVINGCL